MKPKSTLTLLLLLLLLGACVKSEYYRTTSLLINRSTHRIFITPYQRDSAYRFQVVTIDPGDTAVVYEGSGPEKDGASTWGFQMRNFDSLHIVYADTNAVQPHDTAHIGHIRAGLAVPYTHHIPYSSPRSLYNPANWESALDEETTYMRRNHFWYTFTEQDYLDAR